MALDKDLLRDAARGAVPVAAGGGPPRRAPRGGRRVQADAAAEVARNEAAGTAAPASAAAQGNWRVWLTLMLIAAFVGSCLGGRSEDPVLDAASEAAPADALAESAAEAQPEIPPVFDADPPDPGPALLGDDVLAPGVSRVPTLEGWLRIVPAAQGEGQALDFDGAVLEGISGDVLRLVRRLNYEDREVVAGFAGCDEPTPACALSMPFWVVLRPGALPRVVQAPDLVATVDAGLVSADARGVAVDLGITRGQRVLATLTRRDLVHVEASPAPAAALSSAQCATVALALEDCTRAEPDSCATPEGSTARIGDARRLALAYLSDHTAGFDEPAFAALCARSCELGATPSEKLVREELCSGAQPGQWDAPTLPWRVPGASP